MVQVRKVMLDFTDAEVHWSAGNPEYSQLLNTVSCGLPPIEQFLVKAVREVRKVVPEGRDDLCHEIDLFVGQEGRHARLHAQFNKTLRDAGYERVPALEARFKADLDRFFETKDARWCLAYCEGFETVGPIAASFFFERGHRLMRDWHEPTVYLWLWHFAEEYEHRTVCNYLFRDVYGSYWRRLYGLAFLLQHATRRLLPIFLHLMATDWKGTTRRSRVRSVLRMSRIAAELGAWTVPKLARALLPSYDPGPIPPPRQSMELLRAASERYGVNTAA